MIGAMKKLFQLTIEGKNRDRVLEGTKHEIRKYIKRERAKALPEGADFWDFDCQFGLSKETASVVHFANITDCINEAATSGADAFYLEVLARPGVRQPKAAIES
ncbi:MAG: hypothetical protein RIT15_653 [Pseudomonadota bacterium]|jgi:Family of unknown function (DUF6172)